MKSLKKRLYKTWLFINNISYIKENLEEVKAYFNADKIVFSSFGGADINFFIKKDKKTIAMMRLAIVDSKKSNKVIINRFDKEKRINKEKIAYEIAGKNNLTPNLLQYSNNYTICSFIDGLNLNDFLKDNPSQKLNVLKQTLLLYKELHDLNITHLDASLKNIFVDKNDFNKLKIVDFEYYPENNFSLKKQKLFDYLKIFEYTLRKKSSKRDYEDALLILENIIKNEYDNLSLKEIRPLLNSLKSNISVKNFLDSKKILI